MIILDTKEVNLLDGHRPVSTMQLAHVGSLSG
jgi:hypothetical protein